MKKILFMAAMCALCVSCEKTSNADYNNNRMQTNVNQPSDANITSNVKRMIRNDSSLSSSARLIGVSTNNGVVTLTGTVVNSDESSKVERMALGVTGVRSVDNQLSIANY